LVKAEALLKVILTPAEPLVDTYSTLVPDGSEADLKRIMELKGIKGSESSEFLKRYLALTNQKAQVKSQAQLLLPVWQMS